METFDNDINKVVDMLLLDTDDFLNSYSYIKKSDYYETINVLLHRLFSDKDIQEYKDYLKAENINFPLQ